MSPLRIFWVSLLGSACLLASASMARAQPFPGPHGQSPHHGRQHPGGRPWHQARHHQGYSFPGYYNYFLPPTYLDVYGGFYEDFFPPSTRFTHVYAGPPYGYVAPPQPQYAAPPINEEATPAVSRLQVFVPTTDARVWVEGKETTMQGTTRTLAPPPLPPGKTYTYTIRVAWVKDGQKVDQERLIQVSAGSLHMVDFTRSESPERIGPPR